MSGYPRQPYPGQPYPGQPHPHQPYPVVGTNVMAILSLVFAFILSPVGIAFGHIAKRQIRQTGEGGSGLATAGLVISYLVVSIWIAFIVFMITVGAGARAAS